MRLRDRRWVLRVADLEIPGTLDITFKIEKSTKREPNTAEISIFNLNPTSRSIAETGEPRRVVLRAGYAEDGDPPPVLFAGDIRRLKSGKNRTGAGSTVADGGVDWVTSITGRDGGRGYAEARLSRSYAPGTPVVVPVRDALDALQIGRGNLAELEGALALRGGASSLADGYVSVGPARQVLDDLVRGAGLRWSVQNGALQLQRRTQPLLTQAVFLSPAQGLIGSPEKDAKGVVSARSLLQKGLDPGRRVVLDSRHLRGEYEIRRVVYEGESAGQSWYATMELRPFG